MVGLAVPIEIKGHNLDTGIHPQGHRNAKWRRSMGITNSAHVGFALLIVTDTGYKSAIFVRGLLRPVRVRM